MDRTVVTVGETVVITPAPGALELSLQYGGASYRYLGELNGPINYTPMQPGNYTITETFLDAPPLTTEFVALAPPGTPPPEEPQSPSPSSATAEPEEGTGAGDESLPQPQPPSEIELTLVEKGGSRSIRAHAEEAAGGGRDIDLVPGKEGIRLRLKGFRQATGPLALDEARLRPEEARSFARRTIRRSFFIDASSLDFETGEMTLTAAGSELWKCKEWDAAAAACLGAWSKAMDLIPGQEYTVALAPGDPAYVETGVATVNARRPIYRPGEATELVIVVLDTRGYLVEGAEVTLQVTAPDGAVTMLSTAGGSVRQASRGVYEATYGATALEGSYGLLVEAHGPGTDQWISSEFLVKATYPYDILRSTPVTIDPWDGPFLDQVTIVPTNSGGEYSYTEEIPADYEVLDAHGGRTERSGGTLSITWSNLSGETTVRALLQSPLISPALGLLQGSVTDGAGLFREARPWYLAVDPTTEWIVQGGTVLFASGQTQLDFNLSRRLNDTSRAFLLMAASGDSGATNAADHQVTGYILNATTLRFNRYSNTDTPTASYYVVENTGGDIFVQRGGIVVTNTTTNNTGAIATPVNASRSFLTVSTRTSDDDTSSVYEGLGTAELTDGTTVWCRRAVTGGEMTCRYEVVESRLSTLTVQTAETTIASTSANATLATAVDTSRSLLLFSYDASSNGLTQTAIGGRLTSSTLIDFYRYTGTYTNRIRWFVIQFPNGTSAQRNTIDGSARSAYLVESVVPSPSVIVNRSLAFVSATSGGAATAFPRNRWVNYYVSGSNLTIERFYSGQAYYLYWQALEFPPANLIPNVTTLHSPADAANVNRTPADFNFTVVDDSAYLQVCWLWTNATGAWARTANRTAVQNNTQTNITYALADGTYLWNIECQDYYGSTDFYDTNRTVTIDTVAPSWSNVAVSPASGATYSPGASYQFNVTWTDSGSGVNATSLETNFSDTFGNVTPARAGNVSTSTFIDLAAGSYQYRWYANDTASNQNLTAAFTYNISRAAPLLNLTLNGTDGDVDVVVNATLNITGSVSAPAGGYLELYLDGLLINTDYGAIANMTKFTSQKAYNVTVVYNQTRNYSAGSRTHFVYVKDTTPPTVTLGAPGEGAVTAGDVMFHFTPHDNMEIVNCTLILDTQPNQSVNATKDVPANITVAGIPDGPHNWTVNCTDSSNNTGINSSALHFEVDTAPPAAFSLLQPPSGTSSANLSPLLTWSQTAEPHFTNYTVFVDNDINFGSVNYQGATYSINNTSIQLTLGDQTTWHWKVVAYDVIGNPRASNEVFNYSIDASPPAVVPGTPQNDSYINATQANLTYIPDDFAAIPNCILSVDGQPNQTNTTITRDAENWFLITLAEGSHQWSVACLDSAGNLNTTQNLTLTVDTTPPGAFTLSGPPNNTLSSNATPTYTWNATSDLNFANYTVEVSDTEDFAGVNYSFTTAPVGNTSVTQSPPLPDGTWYWRVIAGDKAGNSRAEHPTYIVDTTPPDPFDLVDPPNGTEQRNTTPLLVWQQSGDVHFKNYTLLASSSPTFAYINLSNATYNVSDTNSTLTFPQNVVWYWKVVAWDQANNSRNSTSTFTYVPDFQSPNVTQISPGNGSVINASLVTFTFNATDVGSLANCSLYIDGLFDSIMDSPPTSTTLIMSSSEEMGNHTWYVSCQDLAGNVGNSTVRNFTVNITVPVNVLYEHSGINYTATANINLTYTQDGVENQVSFSVPARSLRVAANASIILNGSGMLILNNTLVNFSGVFSQSNANAFYVTWKLYAVNSTASTLLCQYGNDNTGGAAVGTVAKKTLVGSCTYTGGTRKLNSGNNITLVVDVWNQALAARTFTHFWENTSLSYVRLPAFKLGILRATFVNTTDPAVSEGSAYVEQCNATCTDGACLLTDVYLQRYNGTAWVNVGTTGNVTLNSTQVNPVSLGDVNGSTLANFSLYGNIYSFNNSLRCYANSTYSDNTSTTKNVSVLDRTAPGVTLLTPTDGAGLDPGMVTFSFTAYDKRLGNCSLWGNWTGSWAINQTIVPNNGSPSSFAAVNISMYGPYIWNVNCTDLAGNNAFAPANFTFTVAGDLYLNDTDISFLSPPFVEGKNITIQAVIRNKANRSESNFKVAFYNGDPRAGGTQIGNNVTVSSIPPLGNVTVNQTYLIPVGLSNIFVLIDPPWLGGSIIESNKTNNLASSDFLVPIWQIFFGNVTANVTLAAPSNATEISWPLANMTGNIYITSTGATNGISFQYLQAIGRNTTGGADAETANDFAEIDQLLATTNYTDSVNATYTVGGSPRATETFTVFGENITNVPVTNSSGDGNFTTGILWDTDDSSNSYFDAANKEDLVFVTRIRQATGGAYGVTDYEHAIPSALKGYKGGSTTVTFYYDLQ